MRQILIKKYGAASEKLSSAQLELLELEPGVSSEEAQAESEREAVAGLPATPEEQTSSTSANRQSILAGRAFRHIWHGWKIVACTAEQCRCGGCGEQTVAIGYEVSEQLDVEPLKYFVQVTQREKRACKQCEEQGVATAPVAERIIEKSLVSDLIVIDTIVRKYCDSLPLYRQSVMLKRDTGLEMSPATMDGWVMQVGELLLPIVRGMSRELLSGSYIQADETPVDVQMHYEVARITKPIFGNTERREVVWSSTSGWAVSGKARSGFWANSRASCKPTAMCWRPPHWRAEDGPCRLSGACQTEVHRCGEVESQGSGLGPDRQADG